MKRDGVIVILIIVSLMISVSFVSAGFLDWLGGPKLAPQNYSVTVGNVPPTVVVTYFDNPVSLIQAGTVAVDITFNATDPNGFGDLNDSSIYILFNYSQGADERTGDSTNCPTQTPISDDTKEYNCSINMEHYDAAGVWNITVNISDNVGAEATDNDDTFTVGILKAISLAPSVINFGTVAPGQVNLSPLDNTSIENDGNFDIPTLGLNITSQALIGQTNPNENISGNNFRSADQTIYGCEGEQLIENGGVVLPVFALQRGNQTDPLPTRDVTHCLTLVPAISQQAYSTGGYIPWEFRI